jgi:ribonuclease P protein component
LHRNVLDVMNAQTVPVKTHNTPDLFPVQATWVGAMVPKRWAKRAVTRNAIKRQIYTVSADFLPSLPPAAWVVRLRRDFSRKEFVSASSEALKAAIHSEMLALMRAVAPSP